MAERASVLVYGATGFTGRLIAAELSKQGVSFAIAGRPSVGLESLAAQHNVSAFAADLSEPKALSDAFSRARVVIACAGPFVRTGPALLEAALSARTHLLDLSGEPAHLLSSFERDAEVRAHDVAVVHSVGFDVVPAELLARLTATTLGPLRSLELATGHTAGVASRGTLTSYATMATEAPRRGLAWVDSRFVDEKLGAHRRIVSFSAPLGDRAVASLASAEVALLPRSVHTPTFRHYVGALAPAALVVAEQGLPTFSPQALEKSLSHLEQVGQLGPDAAARAKNHFFLWCRAENATGDVREMTMQGHDPYGLSAVTAVACARAAERDDFRKRGVLSPLQAFEAQPLLAVLAHLGTRWKSRVATDHMAPQ